MVVVVVGSVSFFVIISLSCALSLSLSLTMTMTTSSTSGYLASYMRQSAAMVEREKGKKTGREGSIGAERGVGGNMTW